MKFEICILFLISLNKLAISSVINEFQDEKFDKNIVTKDSVENSKPDSIILESDQMIFQPIMEEPTTRNITVPMNISLILSTDKSPFKNPDYICGQTIKKSVPWIATLVHTDPKGKDPRRTLSKGVLISERHVLTTISSIHNTHPFWIVSEVRLGDHFTWLDDFNNWNGSNLLSTGVDKVYLHQTKDIAIIRLDQIVPISDAIQPICLPFDDNYNFRDLSSHICKRLKRPPGGYEIRLGSAMPVSPQDCSIMFQRRGADFTDQEFCAWDEFGDTCLGDLGGPLTAFFSGKSIVIGLNSYAVTDQHFDADAYPGVYVKVGSYLNWIKKLISINE